MNTLVAVWGLFQSICFVAGLVVAVVEVLRSPKLTQKDKDRLIYRS